MPHNTYSSPRRTASAWWSKLRPIGVASALVASIGFGVFADAGPAAASGAAETSFTIGWVNPGQSVSNYCFLFPSDALEGPVVVEAQARDQNVVIQTTKVNLTYSGTFGWDYCATYTNLSSVGSTVDAWATGAIPSTYQVSVAEPALGAGQSLGYCFHFGNHVVAGPTAAIAKPALANVTMETENVSLEDRQGTGWVYCATIHNLSSTSSAFTLLADGGMSSSSHFNWTPGALAAGATQTYCFNDPASATGVAVIGVASAYNATLVTETTTRENRSGYGWVYCATIYNGSSVNTTVTVETQAGF